MKRVISFLLAISLFLTMIPFLTTPASAITAGIGERKFEGGQRDFKWPVPGWYGLSGCFLEGNTQITECSTHWYILRMRSMAH